ncbi:reverse transcriptase [Pseudomonadaceae bacterium SI-3]|nr:reverse transcriptase [Pseudomonadaceae bacterium SI-3]
MDSFYPFIPNPPYKISNNTELANLLKIPVARLTYYAYYLPDEQKYTSFNIRKRNGNPRLIEAPIKGLKDIQRAISVYLYEQYKPRSCVFAYVQGKGIVEHASIHIGQRWLLRFDLKDFFHTIKTSRISGLLRRPPYSLAKGPAETIARICSKDGRLTQGSPSSPVISNLLCKGLDYKIKELAAKNKCYYSRYADDIFISNNGSVFPSAIAIRTLEGTAELSLALQEIVSASGFQINKSKTTLRMRSERQIVTGIIVNRKSNIPKEFLNSVRAALYAWERFGLEAAENYWRKNIDPKNGFNQEDKEGPRLRWVIRGKINHIAHVKGYSDSTFLSLARRLQSLDSSYKIDEQKILHALTDEIHIYTEGITDTKHIESALKNFKKNQEFSNLNLVLKTPRKPGSASLKSLCESLSVAPQKQLTICIFDRDEPNIIKEMGGSSSNYRDHTNNVFSMIIPTPDFRDANEPLCIEHLYKDEAIYIKDSHGRRLYSKHEFDSLGCHTLEPGLFCRISKNTLIYDDNVIELSKKANIALSKNKFADYISNGAPPFCNIDFSGFRNMFSQITQIAGLYKSN